MRAIMFQGTGSDVGKSLIVAGLARALANRGLRVRPFKPQNMSNNAAVTADGGEIGRAQALQARAARAQLCVDMNPVLLKPQSEVGAQVVVQGRVIGTFKAPDYQRLKPTLLDAVLDSFERLSREADIVLVEGAGSASETNLRAGDIANFGFARAAGVPVVVIGDIGRGGVIASLVGTQAVLEAEDAALVAGFLINRFRGDPTLFDDGMTTIATRTAWEGLGMIPHFERASELPAEDALGLDAKPQTANGRCTKIAVLAYPRISNFDEFDPLRLEPAVDLQFVRPGTPIAGDTALVILPGSKATIADLGVLRATGWDVDLAAHVRRGGRVIGICGGYQMLGRRIVDRDGVEGLASSAEGLGLLDIDTVLAGGKVLIEVEGETIDGAAAFRGYEMHVGRSEGAERARPLVRLADGRTDGAISPDGRICGCYIHGLFGSDALRALWLGQLGTASAGFGFDARIDAVLDALADHLERSIDVDRLLALAREPRIRGRP